MDSTRTRRPNQTRTVLIVPVYNRPKIVHQFLASLRRSTPSNQTAFALVLIDNASDASTKRVLRRVDADLIENQRNRGFPSAINQGVRRHAADWYIVCNSDLILHGGWLDHLLDSARRHRLGIAGYFGRTLIADSPGSVQRTSFVQFCCAAVHRRVFDAIGYLDTRFRLGYFEDDDFCLRASLAGFRLGVILNRDCSRGGKPYVVHLGEQSFGHTADHWMHRNYKVFLAKWDRLWNREPLVRDYYTRYLLDPTAARRALRARGS
jgi:GT2 family glycosyltransferase